MAEVREIVGDAVVSPVRVLAGDSQDEVDHLLRRPRASDALAAAALADALAEAEAVSVPVGVDAEYVPSYKIWAALWNTSRSMS